MSATGQGGAFVSGGDDLSAVYFNPSLLSNLPNNNEIEAVYFLLPNNSNYMGFGIYSGEQDSSGFALTANRLFFDNIFINTDPKNIEDEIETINVQLTYSDYILPARLYWGVNVKYVYTDASQTELENTSQAGALDVGFLYQFYVSPRKVTKINFGISAQNLITVPPTIRIDINDEEITKIPLIIRYGVTSHSYIFPRYNKKKDSLTYDEIKLSLEAGINNNDNFASAGLQYTLIKIFMFRLGYNSENIWFFGGGIEAGDNFIINYSYNKEGKDDVHKAGVNYRWSRNEIVDDYTLEEKELTDDFQRVYKAAKRLYDRYTRDANTMIEANKIASAIRLLNKIIPLAPDDTKALTLLNGANSLYISQETDKHMTQSQMYWDRGSEVAAYKEMLKAYDVNPKTVMPELTRMEVEAKEANQKALRDLHNNQINEYEKEYARNLEKGDFSSAFEVRERLYYLLGYRDQRYDSAFVRAKIVVAEKYLNKSTKEKNIIEKYRYIVGALELLPRDPAIIQQEKLIVREYKRQREYKEDELYNEKLYYLAAIALASKSRRQAQEAYTEVAKYNLFYKNLNLIEKYLVINKTIEKLNP